MVVAHLQLAKVMLRLDQPRNALEVYQKACEKFPSDTACMLGIARVHDALNEQSEAVAQYKKVLELDASNVIVVLSSMSRKVTRSATVTDANMLLVKCAGCTTFSVSCSLWSSRRSWRRLGLRSTSKRHQSCCGRRA